LGVVKSCSNLLGCHVVITMIRGIIVITVIVI